MEARFSKKEFVALMAALMTVDVLAIDIMLPALPQIGNALGVTNPNDRSLVFTAFLLGFGLPQLIFGPIADRFGRRRVILGGLLAYCAATIVAVVAPNFAVMLALRFLQGAAAAAVRVGMMSAVRDRYAGRGHGRGDVDRSLDLSPCADYLPVDRPAPAARLAMAIDLRLHGNRCADFRGLDAGSPA